MNDFTLHSERRPLWDTLTIAAGATAVRYSMFATPFGGAVLKQTTNVPKAGQILPGEHFTLKSIRLMVIGAAAADFAGMHLYAVEFKVNGILRTEGPLPYFAGGAGVSGISNVAATEQLTNGVANPQAITIQDPEIEITGNDTFGIDLLGTSFVAAGTIVVKAILDGVWDFNR